MPNLKLLPEITREIRKSVFPDFPDTPINDLEYCKLLLKKKVKEKLSTNLNELLSILYRVDISEVDVQKAFLLSSEEAIAQKLAALILERQIQKIEFRKKYRKD